MELENQAVQEQAQEIAKALGETEEVPIRQIESIVKVMGEEFAKAAVQETLEIEEKGGLKTEDGKRRRTVGGVFFYLVKGKLTNSQKLAIFPNFGQKYGEVVEWAERIPYLTKLFEEPDFGKIRHLSITVHGRPGEIIEHDNTIIIPVVHEHKPTPFPRGVPQPPLDPAVYVVYMAKKHWEAIKESLENYPSDRMVVEGSCYIDIETQSIAIFAINVTTRRLRKEAKRLEENPEAASGDGAEEGEKANGKKPDAEAKASKEKKKKPKKDKPASEPAAAAVKLPPDVAKKLDQLNNAANTLRQRIEAMESSGQAGVAMTKKLLRNTEKQIAAIEKQYMS